MTAYARTAWIIGGGTGIGRACSQSLAERGWNLVVSGRRAGPLDQLVASIREEGGQATALKLDVTDPRAVETAARTVREIYGGLDAVTYSAGTNQTLRRWSTMTPDAYDAILDTNLNGAYRVIHHALPALRSSGGNVVVIGSWAGWRFDGRVGPAYSTSKTALEALVETINAEEHAHNVRATLLNPGEVRTEILLRRPTVPTEEEQELMLQPSDVGDAVAWILEQPPRLCVNQLVMTPVANFAYRAFGENPER